MIKIALKDGEQLLESLATGEGIIVWFIVMSCFDEKEWKRPETKSE